MSPASAGPPPPEAWQTATVAEYLVAIRRHWRMIATLTVSCGALAVGLAGLIRPTYAATASESVQDPSQLYQLVGTPAGSSHTQLQVASAHLGQVTRDAVVRAVKAALHSPLSASALRALVDTEINQDNNLLTITAESRSAAAAAVLANAFANQDARLSSLATRAAYAAQAHAFQVRLRATALDPVTRVALIRDLSRLQTLSAVAQPVSVRSAAQAQATPITPNRARDALAAAAAGLLLAIALAFAHERFDRRLRDREAVERGFREPVLGLVDEAGGLESMFALRKNIEFVGVPGAPATLLVTSAGPGEGKSSVAVGLARASVATGRRALLVEADLRRPVLAERLGLRPTPGLADHLTGEARPGEILQTASIEATPDGSRAVGRPLVDLVCIVAGNQPPDPAALLDSIRFRALVGQAADVYDLVVIDAPPLLVAADALAIAPTISAVLVCVRLGHTTRDQLRAVERTLSQLPGAVTGLVLTDVGVTKARWRPRRRRRPEAVRSTRRLRPG